MSGVSSHMLMEKTLELSHPGDVHSLCVHGNTLVTTSGDRAIRVFSSYTERPYSPLYLHKYHVISSTISQDGRLLVCTSMDGKVSYAGTHCSLPQWVVLSG